MKKIVAPLFLLCLWLRVLPQADLTGISTWAYQLQNININTIASNPTFHLIVTDYSYDGTDPMKLSNADVATVQSSGKKHISYISIGEAENYRSYWQSSWSTSPPSWLGAENPDWPGNYKVKYWDPAWQNLVFDYVDTIIGQGFDGIYLDIIDGWYYWQTEVPQAQQVSNADSLMIDFVLRIRAHVNAVTVNANFIMMPQNGEDLIFQAGISGNLRNQYYAAIDAVGIEDVFFTGSNNMDNPYAPDTYRLNNLAQYQAHGKKVFNIEYLSQAPKIQQYKDTAEHYNFVPYTCDRPLDQLCDGIATGIKEVPVSSFDIFPNLVIDNKLLVLCRECPVGTKYFIMDLEGRKTELTPQAIDMNYSFTIPSAMTNGMYLLVLERNNSPEVRRFVIER